MTLCDNDSSPTDQHLLQQNILKALSSAPGDFTAQCQQLQPFLNGDNQEACKIILHNLVQLHFSQSSACTHWNSIVAHAEKMQHGLDRTVGLATAACDYFSTVQPCLDNPKLIEFIRFEETLKSAHQDFLTGLLSRRTFQTLFDQEISRAKRHKHNSTLIFFDLDNFKEINDTHGHLAGDEVLKEVAKVLNQSKRKEDLSCRFGGDEFVILLPETNKFKGMLVGKKFIDQINNLTIHYEDKEIHVRCSGGLATFPADSTDSQGLIRCADQALYQAKSRGKHKLSLFSVEKRTFTRIEFERTVTIRPLGIPGEIDNSIARNISEGGILISSKKGYDLGARLELQVPLKEDGDSLTIFGSVVRVEQFDNGLYDIGLSFLLIDSTTSFSEAIADYIVQQT